jgi:hypothetical protein
LLLRGLAGRKLVFVYEVEAVIKTDVLGWMQTPAAQREQSLDEFERNEICGVGGDQVALLPFSCLILSGNLSRATVRTFVFRLARMVLPLYLILA